MVISTKSVNAIATDILRAIDSSELNNMNTLLEINVEDGNLTFSVTNKEYFVSVKLPAAGIESFHATVNANLLFKLIAQTTTEDIELECKDNYLQVKGNGSYKIPLIFDKDEVVTLKRIEINNPTCEMVVDKEVLSSIFKYNSKELSKGLISKPVQRYYYVDEKGCITFTTGACVNKFNLPQPIRILLNNRIVNLFKLFKEDLVELTLGYDQLSSSIIQTKLRLEAGNVQLTTILQCDDTMINSVPVASIRGMAEAVYPYSVVLCKDVLMQAIGRLQLFSKNIKGSDSATKCTFYSNKVLLSNLRGDIVETVDYVDECSALEDNPYEAALDLDDLKSTLQLCDENHLTLKFGVGKAFIIARTSIINIIPQCVIS